MKVILGTKVGMTQIIGKDGVVTPVTIIEAGPATVMVITLSSLGLVRVRI